MFDIVELKARKLLTRDETAYYMGGISKNSLTKIIHGTDFPALVRIGGRVLINRERLDEWIDERTGK